MQKVCIYKYVQCKENMQKNVKYTKYAKYAR